MTHRRRMIDDPRRPHRIKIGVPYRVVEVEGELVVREELHSGGIGLTTRKGVHPESRRQNLTSPENRSKT